MKASKCRGGCSDLDAAALEAKEAEAARAAAELLEQLEKEEAAKSAKAAKKKKKGEKACFTFPKCCICRSFLQQCWDMLGDLQVTAACASAACLHKGLGARRLQA